MLGDEAHGWVAGGAGGVAGTENTDSEGEAGHPGSIAVAWEAEVALPVYPVGVVLEGPDLLCGRVAGAGPYG